MISTNSTSSRQRRRVTPNEWERAWQQHWTKVGPAVTVFGSARFEETHPFCKLARATGAELARAGFATLIQCQKTGPFPLILLGPKFWAGLQRWGQDMMKEGVFTRDEIGFDHVTDSPKEAVDLIVRSLPSALRNRLTPLRPALHK